MKYWVQQPGIVTRTKIPNPYWSAQTWARIYRERLQRRRDLLPHTRRWQTLSKPAPARLINLADSPGSRGGREILPAFECGKPGET